MSALTRATFISKWDAIFAPNGNREITAEDMQEFLEDIKDSFLNTTDQEYSGIKGLNSGLNTITGLKTVSTASLDTGVSIAFRDTDNSDVFRFYELIAGTTAESSPDIIRPDDYDGTTNQKIWSLAEITVSTIDGGSL